MSKGQKHIIIDGYTHDLLQQAVDSGKASDIADAVLHGISDYLCIRYKSSKERKLEQEASRIQKLGKSNIPESF